LIAWYGERLICLWWAAQGVVKPAGFIREGLGTLPRKDSWMQVWCVAVFR